MFGLPFCAPCFAEAVQIHSLSSNLQSRISFFRLEDTAWDDSDPGCTSSQEVCLMPLFSLASQYHVSEAVPNPLFGVPLNLQMDRIMFRWEDGMDESMGCTSKPRWLNALFYVLASFPFYTMFPRTTFSKSTGP
jgi:hypothetical protein